jgi:uncharacterized low-complexity protein
MRRIPLVLLVLGALTLVLAACGSSGDSSSLDMGKARSEITQLATHAYSAEATVGEVKCPSIDVPLKKGLSFLCTVEIDGVPLRLSLRETDAKGNVHIDQNQALIITKKLEDFVGGYASQHGRPTSSVSCSKASVITATPGQKLPCTIAYANGTTGTAQVGVRDTTGKVALLNITP